MLLVDTSVWIEIFRRPAGVMIADFGELDEIATCLPVVQEVLQGFRDEHSYHRARTAMLNFPVVESPLERDVFLEAAGLYRAARQVGVTVRSGVDCLIAACALRHGLTVVHVDRDFDALGRVCGLRTRRLSPR